MLRFKNRDTGAVVEVDADEEPISPLALVRVSPEGREDRVVTTTWGSYVAMTHGLGRAALDPA